MQAYISVAGDHNVTRQDLQKYESDVSEALEAAKSVEAATIENMWDNCRQFFIQTFLEMSMRTATEDLFPTSACTGNVIVDLEYRAVGKNPIV